MTSSYSSNTPASILFLFFFHSLLHSCDISPVSVLFLLVTVMLTLHFCHSRTYPHLQPHPPALLVAGSLGVHGSDLSSGIRHIFTTEGNRVRTVDQLTDGSSYVASPTAKFQVRKPPQATSAEVNFTGEKCV